MRMLPLILAAAQGSICLAQPERLMKRELDNRILWLAPTPFPMLPRGIVSELQRRGCSIPQAQSATPMNVIRGAFAMPGQTDWAVLCSVKGATAILVFWNGSGENPAEIARQDDGSPLNQSAIKEFELYPRSISTSAGKEILLHHSHSGGPKPPPLEHEGIQDGTEKGSVIHYFYRGKWLQLTGAD
jgi:hypothetical protein